MRTDILNKIESLDTRRFTDYELLGFDIRDAIQAFIDANDDKLYIDQDFDGYYFRANSLDYIKSIFNKKLDSFRTNFFWNEELIREVIKKRPDILDVIKAKEFRYFRPLYGQQIGKMEQGPGILIKQQVTTKYFNDNYKTGYYVKPKEKEKEGCFVATFAYESYEHENVLVLRKIRDEVLLKSPFGRNFISKYYQYSPSLINILNKVKFPRQIIRHLLDCLVFVINKSRT